MVSLIPQPVSLCCKDERFVFQAGVTFAACEALFPEAVRFAEWLSEEMEVLFPVSKISDDSASDEYAVLFCLASRAMNLGEEGYRLDVSSGRIVIQASGRAGAFYATQSLKQCVLSGLSGRSLNSSVEISAVSIHDKPEFGWRGMHLDVSRHFMPTEFIKKFLDLLAFHKLNVFHWHLTDDQGWRVEIKKYPKLTEIGAWREETIIGHDPDYHLQEKPFRSFDGTRHGGFYTQDELCEIVAYARERHIRIVPEIDMPGHMQAAVTAYPELGNTGKASGVRTHWGVSIDILNPEEETIHFMQDVLSEMMDIFPDEYIHIGGDEANKEQWRASESVQARIKELGLKDEDELQSWFIRQMDTFLADRGRRLIGWDEILDGGLAPNATVMSWQGIDGALKSAPAGHDVVMSDKNVVYFDFYQNHPEKEPLAFGDLTTTRDVYAFNPVPDGLAPEYRHHILGGQGQLWTEYMPTPQQVEYMAFPRLCALAETLWSPADVRDWDSFEQRLKAHCVRLDKLVVNYYRGPLDVTVK